MRPSTEAQAPHELGCGCVVVVEPDGRRLFARTCKQIDRRLRPLVDPDDHTDVADNPAVVKLLNDHFAARAMMPS